MSWNKDDIFLSRLQNLPEIVKLRFINNDLIIYFLPYLNKDVKRTSNCCWVYLSFNLVQIFLRLLH